jgi:putative protease
MSYAVGGRSGNRGECAQPCRRRYDLVDSWDRLLVEDRHLLSLRDMNRMADLGPLLDAGVSSFKIEGRLKDEVYVANVVSAYRRALNAELAQRGMARSSSGVSRAPFTPDVAKTFNRAFTPYFLHGREQPPGAVDTPKMVGEPIGTVTGVSAGSEFTRTFTLRTDADLNNGDGLTLFDAGGRLRGASVNQARRVPGGMEVTLNSPVPVEPGTRIYRNHDHAFLQEVRKQPPERTIAVRFTLAETAAGFTLTVEDEDGVTAIATLEEEKAVARKPEQAVATAHEQIAKTGGTPFHSESVTVEWSTPYFLPFSTLNDLRRRALDALLAARAVARPTMTGTPEVNDVPYPETVLTFRGNVLNDQAAAFYRRHGVTEIEPAAESGLAMHGRVVMTTRYCIKEQMGWCPRQSGSEEDGDDAIAQPDEIHEPLYLIDEDGHRYQLRFHCDQAPSGCGMEVRY